MILCSRRVTAAPSDLHVQGGPKMENTGTIGGFEESANNPMGNHEHQLKARVGVVV